MRYKALDGLRGIAAVLVVLHHFLGGRGLTKLAIYDVGDLGVQIFFALSGFLMGKLYLDKPLTAPNLWSFGVARFARVVPLYWLIVLASFGLMTFAGNSWPLPAVSADNLFQHLLFWKGAGLLWTIPPEIQFYAVFPLFWLAAQRGGAAGFAFAVLASLIVAGVLGFPETPVLLKAVGFFVGGMVISRIPAVSSRGFDLAFAFFVAATVLALPDIRAAFAWGGKSGWGEILSIVIPCGLVFSAAYSPVATTVLGSRPMAFLGNISFSIYLWHVTVILVLGRTGIHSVLTPPFSFPVVLTTTIIVSTISWLVIERPAQRWVRAAGARLVAKPDTVKPLPPLAPQS